MDASAVLTPSRNAVWTCIDNWAGLADASTPTGRVFNREIKFAGDMPAFVNDPNPSDLPAITVVPVNVLTPWLLNQAQEWTIATAIKIFTADHHVDVAEQIVEEVIRALFRYADPGTPTVPYIKGSCGILPEVTSIDFALTTLGQKTPVPVVITTLNVGLRKLDNPFVD